MMDYALIEDGKVINIISLHPMNSDDFPNAVPINGLPVQIGYDYKEGKYYNNGVEVTNSINYDRIKDLAIQEVQDELNKETDGTV